MHRKRVARLGLFTFLVGLAALAGARRAAAQEPVPPPTPNPSVIIPLNGTVPVQMSTKKLIKNVEEDTPGAVIGFQILKKDPSTVLITGRSPGIAVVTLTDADGRKEVFEFVVQTDVQYLKFVLKKAVPTASIEPIASANNTFILTGTVQRSEDVQIVIDTVRSVVGNRVINALRVGGVMQVQLEVVVARVARSEARLAGFSFLETGKTHYVSSILSSPLFLTGTNLANVSSAVANLSGSPNAVFGIVNDKQGFSGYLSALRNNNLVKVLAEPKLVTLSGRPAEFISGGEQAVPTLASGSAGGGAVSGVEFRPFGTTVRFLPIVLGNGKIYLEVEPQFTFPDPSNLFSAPIPGTNSVVFGRTTQRVQTSVILEDCQTFAIGGMVFHSMNGNSSKVPILGDLPFIGAAFSTINYTDSEEELLVLVTPRLVDPMDCTQLPKYLPGQETRNPDDFELFLERILEAPRGPRRVFHGLCYVPAYKNSPTVNSFPCAGGHHTHGRCDCANPPGIVSTCPCGDNGHGANGCGAGGCGGPGNGAGAHEAAPAGDADHPANMPNVPAALPVTSGAAPAGDRGMTPASGVESPLTPVPGEGESR
jgi:pilus assembly protein CpaC